MSSQLEESNRTLTVDVANLASEKEELNNQLKELQQRESSFELMSAAENYRNYISFIYAKCVETLSYLFKRFMGRRLYNCHENEPLISLSEEQVSVEWQNIGPQTCTYRF